MGVAPGPRPSGSVSPSVIVSHSQAWSNDNDNDNTNINYTDTENITIIVRIIKDTVYIICASLFGANDKMLRLSRGKSLSDFWKNISGTHGFTFKNNFKTISALNVGCFY